MSSSKFRLFKSVVYSAACVLLAAATMPAGIAAGVDPAQRFEAAPEIEGGATLNLPRSLAAKDQSVIVVARLAADPITVVIGSEPQLDFLKVPRALFPFVANFVWPYVVAGSPR
jgi:hypothetical protein